MSFNRIFEYNPLEFDMYITPDGETYRFNNTTDKFSLGRTGDGLPPITYITDRGPYQPGETPLNYIVGSRVITLTHIRKAKSRQGYYDNRNELIEQLRPNRQALNSFQPGVLRKVLPDGSKRDLLVFISDGLVFPNRLGEWREHTITEVIRFIAHDPIYYDPDEIIVEYALGSDANQLTFPITFPIHFNATESVEAFNVDYDGTWESYPTINLRGPMTNPAIKNITTNEVIKLNYTIADGEIVIISLGFGNKFVQNGLGTNLIGYVDENSDLVSFKIVPEPIASNGVNSFGVSAEDITANSKLYMKYFTRYIAI